MPTPSYLTHCLSKRSLAHDVIEFTLEKPKGFSHTSGHFILFDIPLIDNPSDLQSRAYSIASSGEEPELLFVVRLKQWGRASRYFSEVMKEGTELTMKGPLGNFLLPKNDSTNLIFLCTCTGVAPFRAMAVDLLSDPLDQRKIDLFFGVRSMEDVFWSEEFQEMQKHHPRFQYHLILSRPEDTWTGLKGHIQDHVQTLVPDLSSRSLYVCGNPAMTKEVKEIALGTWGLPKERVHMEGFV